MNDFITYTKKGNIVKIEKFGEKPIYLNRENIVLAIENINSNRSDYKTEEAYKTHLAIYQDALKFLDGES